jgi:hypothetical protein
MHIVAEFNGAGISAEHMSAFTSTDERTAILARHSAGETRVVSCVALLREGWDSPSTQTMILARPTPRRSRSCRWQGAAASALARPKPCRGHSGSVLELGRRQKTGRWISTMASLARAAPGDRS